MTERLAMFRKNLIIEDLEVIPKKIIFDNRGKSSKLYSKSDRDIDELFVSSSKKGVIRGIHFQDEPYSQRKSVTVLKGKIKDVVIDLRQNSSTYLSVESFDLDEDTDYSLLIPRGCGHGFLALDRENIVLYGIEGVFEKSADSGILWSSIDYDWKIANPILSERDQNFPTLEEYLYERTRKNESGV